MILDPIKYAFFGSPRFAALILTELINQGYIPQMIVCNPDRPVGRKKIITPPLTKQLAASRKAQIEILQPENPIVICDKLSAIRPDFFIVAAYAKIIPKEILAIPRLGTIGVHPSLLPKYRGASPIQSALLAGEKGTGVTLYLMDERMDHGPVLAQAETALDPNDNYGSLEEKLGQLGAKLLVETLPKIITGQIKPQDQNHAEATFTKKFKTEDGYIDEKDLLKAVAGDKLLAKAILGKIRALNPEPGAWTIQKRKRTKIIEAEIKAGKLILKKIQIEGHKPQHVS